MNYGPTKMLTLAHPAFAGADGTANKLSDVFTWTVPQGLGWVFPGRHPLVLKLRSDASTELPDTAEIYFGFRTPDDPRRTVPIGTMILYQPFGDLTTAQQQDQDYERSVTIDLGKAFLPLVQDETLVVSVYATAAVDVTYCEFVYPYAERKPSDLIAELAMRKTWWGR